MLKSKEKDGKNRPHERHGKPHEPATQAGSMEPVTGREGTADTKHEETLRKLEEKEKESAVHYDRYLRTAADLENYKKRAAREHAELVKYGNEKLIRDLLPILDSLDRALKQTSEMSVEMQAFIEGLKLIDTQFLASLQKHGVERIEAKGKEFDPNLHQAVLMVEGDDGEDNKVIEEFEIGYLLNGRLLRPAKVSVSRRTVKSAEGEGRG
jgi:molecular chaperone GrpE